MRCKKEVCVCVWGGGGVKSQFPKTKMYTKSSGNTLIPGDARFNFFPWDPVVSFYLNKTFTLFPSSDNPDAEWYLFKC